MSISIQELIKTLGISIQDAQDEISKEGLLRDAKYFTESELENSDEMILIPKCVSFPIPHSTEGKSVEIPIITLVNHRSLELESVEINMSVNTQWNAEEEFLEVDVSPLIDDESSEKNGINKYNSTTISMKFKSKSSAEGISKHVESYYQQFKRENY